jgi:cyclopropane-fatty-acyl-phospholipid synthase
MTSTNVFPGIQKHIPIMGDMNLKSPIAYKATRLMARVFNATQMALAEAYINGLEIPDSVFRALVHTSMPILFQHAPGLLAPYEWVLKRNFQHTNELKDTQSLISR